MPAAHEAPLWQLPMLARAPETGGTRAVLEREARSHYPVCGVTKTAIYRPKDIGLREDRARGGQGIDGGVDALGSTRHDAAGDNALGKVRSEGDPAGCVR